MEAVRLAAVETDMEERDFPEKCLWNVEDILTEKFDQSEKTNE